MKMTNVLTRADEAELSDEAQEMTIDENSSVLLMDALGKLYSRPARAALREYLSNAIDAHVEAGGGRPPIEVTLPDDNSQMLTIRDYGNGMSEADFGRIISRYGASTKRSSNKLTGGFGLGAKVGFALGDEFFMTSYQQGQMVKARIFKQSGGKGYVEIVERADTLELDGMLVQVQVPFANISELELSILEGTHFFEAFSEDELVVRDSRGALNFYKSSVQNRDVFTPLTLTGKTFGWVRKVPSPTYSSIRGGHAVRALIGRVSYTLWDEDLYVKIPSLRSLSDCNYDFVLNLPIGSLDLPSSREEITTTERSINTITNVADAVLRLFTENLQKELNSYDNRQDAICKVLEIADAHYCPVKDMTWRGEAFPLKFETSETKLSTAKGRTLLSAATVATSIDVEGGSVMHFRKIPYARPSLEVENVNKAVWHLHSFFNPEYMSRNKTISITVSGDYEDFLGYQKAISNNISAYRSSIFGDEDDSLKIVLTREGEAVAEWFKVGEIVTFESFMEQAKKYRSEQRKKLKAANGSSPKAAPTTTYVPIYWLPLDEESLNESNYVRTGNALEILPNTTDFYYIARDSELKDNAAALHIALDFMKSVERGKISASAKSYLIAIGEILGPNAKLAFVPSTRNKRVFSEKHPELKPVLPALREKVAALWADAQKSNVLPANVLSSRLWETSGSSNISHFRDFYNVLNDEEKATLNADLRDFAEYANHSHGGYSAEAKLVASLFDWNTRKAMSQWFDEKINPIFARYRLLAYTRCFRTSDWEYVKDDLLEYVNSR